MSLCLGAACKLSYWSECLEKMRAPSQALLQAHPSIDTVS